MDKNEKIVIINPMTDINLGKMISKYVNYQTFNSKKQAVSQNVQNSFSSAQSSAPQTTRVIPSPQMAKQLLHYRH